MGLADWDTYLAMDRALSRSGLRVRYLRGVFEVMSISRPHEYMKSIIGSLVDTFCRVTNIEYYKWGSATNRVEGVAGAEPDESFTFGAEDKPKPDLVIEVAFSSGGIDKCALWAELGAREIWVWERDRLHGFDLESGTPEPLTTSRVLPGLKLATLEAAAHIKPTSAACREFAEQLASAK